MEVYYVYFQMVSLLLIFVIACATLIFYPQPSKDISSGAKQSRIGSAKEVSQSDRKS